MLIVGLGNPGEKYKNTRHNIGFLAVDEFAGKNSFPDFVFSKKFNALVSEGEFNGQKIILLKPQTFMNESGRAVKKIIENCKLKIENLTVVHDDIDLPLGKIKIVKNRGSAGHKGVASIIKEIGSNDFSRIRIGINPQKTENREQKTEKFVLQKFSKEEKEKLKEIIGKAAEIIEILISEGVEKAMNEYNK